MSLCHFEYSIRFVGIYDFDSFQSTIVETIIIRCNIFIDHCTLIYYKKHTKTNDVTYFVNLLDVLHQ